ncbi:MAG: alpha/beta fold hydrolase [Gemmatimonas sp.]|jgi:pimeloyl-ACP methyl ester carboxylesterase|uniref:alpha/beta fold hydrolase n=1 Tax=Gemmatimonas sp. TaxID=1962908 RepID=UPI00391F8AC0|nr:alpha/beta fold hydrolase [Gemmatimonadota bacterium]
MNTLPNPLGGERRFYAWRGWQVAYVVRGHGEPLVFLHSIHAAAWSAEWRHTVPALAEHATCYALDLLGFGASDRPAISYTADLYLELVRDFLRDVVAAPAVLVGSSLGGTYAIEVAATHPELVRAVCAIGPAGVSRLVRNGGVAGDMVQGLFRTPVIGEALFQALVSRASIRFFLKDIYADPIAPEALDLFWQSANQPNARYAPAAFVGMRLNVDIRRSLPAVAQPLLLVWGTAAAQTPFREASAVRALVPKAEFVPIRAGDLPHDEHPRLFNPVLQHFLGALPVAAAA